MLIEVGCQCCLKVGGPAGDLSKSLLKGSLVGLVVIIEGKQANRRASSLITIILIVVKKWGASNGDIGCLFSFAKKGFIL